MSICRLLPGAIRCQAPFAARRHSLPGAIRCPAARRHSLPGAIRCPAPFAARRHSLPGASGRPLSVQFVGRYFA
jgi:hypothetical protein